MCCEFFWKRTVTFCLAFIIGIFVSDWYILSNFNHIESEPQEIRRPVVLLNPQDVKREGSPKPLCKKYFDSERINELAELNREIKETEELLKRDKNLSLEKKKSHLLKLEEARKKFSDLYKTLTELKSLQIESDPLHKLLYVENCARY